MKNENEMMNQSFCQSCAMPMGETDELYGTNHDGSKNEDYCKYCFDQGQFAADCTMDEMIDFCIPHMANEEHGITAEQGREMMEEVFPMLKRWKA